MSRSWLCTHALILLSVMALVVAAPAHAQITNVTSDQAPPIPGVGHDYIKMLNETVNPSTGSVSIRITAPVPRGRGITIPFAFAYDSNAARHKSGPTSLWDNSNNIGKGGWSYVLPTLSFQQHMIQYIPQGGGGPSTCFFYNDQVFQDPAGTTHNLGLAVFQKNNTVNCVYLGGGSQYGPDVLSGGDPWVQGATVSEGSSLVFPPVTVSDSSGTVYYFSNTGSRVHVILGGWSSFPDWIEDRNGNKITITDNGNGAFVIPDTLGRSAISSSGFGTSGNTVSVSGLSAYTVNWGTTNINWTYHEQTAHDGGDGVCSSGPGTVTQSAVPEISGITLPNGKSYQFQYDPTSGLLSKIIYPTGGYIRYVWQTHSLSDSMDFYADSLGSFSCHQLYDPSVSKIDT